MLHTPTANSEPVSFEDRELEELAGPNALPRARKLATIFNRAMDRTGMESAEEVKEQIGARIRCICQAERMYGPRRSEA